MSNFAQLLPDCMAYLFKIPCRVVFFSFLLLCSCVQDKKSTTSIHFDSEKLSNVLVQVMQGASIKKSVVSSDSSFEFSNNQTSIDFWEKELKMLASCNINKPAFWGNYQISKNLDTTNYVALLKKFPVRLVQVVEDEHGNLKKISIQYQALNPLFKIYREIEYFFQDNRIGHYSIKNRKDVVGLGEFNYQINAVVSFLD